MFYNSDLHIHSHFADATSPKLQLESLYQFANIKGINVLGTGDFTHPGWVAEISKKLAPAGNGFYRLTDPPKEPGIPGIMFKDSDPQFCLSAEVSCSYVSNGKQRSIHHLLFAPSVAVVESINKRLSVYGDLLDDGRPTINLTSRNLLELIKDVSPEAYLIPAHVWTPWHSMLGSACGYNSVEECFLDMSNEIFALETGLSTDPAMNRRCSMLDGFTMISCSDAHSLKNLGREVSLFNTDISYDAMFEALKTRSGFSGTYEYFPEAGKYSYDGHEKCKQCLSPSQSRTLNNRCPSCGRLMTIGAFHRVEELGDREQEPEQTLTHYHCPLSTILAELYQSSVESKKTAQAYIKTINRFGNEFSVLQEAPVADVERISRPLAGAIATIRSGKVKIDPGYDGVYGKFHFSFDQPNRSDQLSLF